MDLINKRQEAERMMSTWIANGIVNMPWVSNSILDGNGELQPMYRYAIAMLYAVGIPRLTKSTLREYLTRVWMVETVVGPELRSGDKAFFFPPPAIIDILGVEIETTKVPRAQFDRALVAQVRLRIEHQAKYAAEFITKTLLK